MAGDRQLQDAYASCMGQSVVLQVSIGDLKVPLRGTMLSESKEAVRMRIGEGWAIDVFKNMILTVDRDKSLPSNMPGERKHERQGTEADSREPGGSPARHERRRTAAAVTNGRARPSGEDRTVRADGLFVRGIAANLPAGGSRKTLGKHEFPPAHLNRNPGPGYSAP